MADLGEGRDYLGKERAMAMAAHGRPGMLVTKPSLLSLHSHTENDSWNCSKLIKLVM